MLSFGRSESAFSTRAEAANVSILPRILQRKIPAARDLPFSITSCQSIFVSLHFNIQVDLFDGILQGRLCNLLSFPVLSRSIDSVVIFLRMASRTSFVRYRAINAGAILGAL